MENEFSRAVDVIPGLVWIARPDGHVDHVNRGWCEYTGGTPDKATGQGWLDAIHPDDLPELRERWHVIVASRQPLDMSARLRRFDTAKVADEINTAARFGDAAQIRQRVQQRLFGTE